MKMKTSMKLLIGVAFATLSIHQTAQAGSHTWSGANDVYFNNASNWSYGGAPTNGEQNVYLYFPSGAAHYNCMNNISGLTVNGIGFSGDNYYIGGNSITFSSAGQPSLTDSGDANGFWAPLVLNTNLNVNVSSGKTVYLNGVISGPGGLSLIGPGAVRFNGVDSNTYTGTTYVNNGMLIMSRGSGLDSSIAGPLVVGTALGSPGTAIAKIGSNNQIGNSFPVTVNFTGVLDADNNTDWISGLIMAGGKVQTGTGKIAVTGDITVQAGAATIEGNLGLYNSTNCTISAEPAGTLTINAMISAFNNTIGIIKTGAGSLDLYGANTFGGPVLVKQGYLSLDNPKSLGQSSGLSVTNIGIVQLFNAAITNIPATLFGNGNGNGALRAFGTNVWSGQMILAGNSGIQPLASSDLLTIDGSISGKGNLTKLGAGKLIMAGSGNNTYDGNTFVSGGTLQLSKSNTIAIPSALTIGNPTNAANSHIVKLTSPDQIHDLADVTVNASGVLDLGSVFGCSDTIGSLAGTGNLWLGWNKLASGTNGATTTFSGTITGVASSVFEKQGGGELFLNGDCSAFPGSTYVTGGTLSVNGLLGNGMVHVYSGATLAGIGYAGPVSALSGKVAPGNSPGLLNSANFALGATTALEIELAGNNAGVDYDQVNVTGGVTLGGASLNVRLSFASAISNQFLIIKNDGNDAVAGTFNGLPEGGTFYANGAQFQITYKGGDGNDVVLTQIGLPQPSHIGGITQINNGQIQIAGNGNPGMVYGIEANSDLNTTNWVNIGVAQANQLGEVGFIDTDAPNHAIRFYRFIAK